jgi:transposase InsO family protein
LRRCDTARASGNTPEKPIEWLTDNGSCYTEQEARKFAKAIGLKPITTPVESRQSNGMTESFVKTFKRDYARLSRKFDYSGTNNYLIFTIEPPLVAETSN